MEATPTVESVIAWFNAAGFGFMMLGSGVVCTWFDSLFGGGLVGDGDLALLRERSRFSVLGTTQEEGDKMIGTKYTSGMLAAFAKSSRLRRVDVRVGPDGREIAFYSRRYVDGGGCASASPLGNDGGRTEYAFL